MTKAWQTKLFLAQCNDHDGQLLQPRAGKKELVHQLLSAKEDSGKSFTEIGRDLGLTNMYTAQLFHNQVGADVIRRSTPVEPHPSSGRGLLAASGGCAIGIEVSVESADRKTQWEPDVHSKLFNEVRISKYKNTKRALSKTVLATDRQRIYTL